jgi:hypothetical protein
MPEMVYVSGTGRGQGETMDKRFGVITRDLASLGVED